MVIDHVGIAVPNIDKALPFYEKILGLKVVHREDVAEQKTRVAFLRGGESLIELLEATSSGSPVARFIERRGPGLHHVAFMAIDLWAYMEELRKEGIPPQEASPRSGARGRKVCFLHPKHSGGVLVEFVEYGR